MQLRIGSLTLLLGAVGLFASSAGPAARAQQNDTDLRRQPYDELLDLNVRDGYVSYRTLKATRGGLDRFVASLGTASIENVPRSDQAAFWVNAYNAIVLQTVIDHYPIVQRSTQYPARSIRQIPGAFERLTHHVAGRMVTLDDIEQRILTTFHDPRLFLALGRGAVGSGRLRSEAYAGNTLEQQLESTANECLSHAQCVTVESANNRVRVSSIFSWREADFVAAFGDKAPDLFKARSAVERAVLAFVSPRLLATERDFLAKNEFKVDFLPFDWTLNDLTGR